MQFENSEFNEAYNILCAKMPAEKLKEGIYPTLCKIQAGGKTTQHSHFEPEIFYIIKGFGELILDSNHYEVKTGTLIRLPGFSTHQLINKGSEELHFLSVYSEDFEVNTLPSSTIITTAPPTPNGPLHLGHMSGPYLAGDFLRRYLKLKNSEVESISGTDDHQNYVGTQAKKQNQDSENFRKEMRKRIESGLSHFKVSYDRFIEPKTDKKYREKVLQFHKIIRSKGIINKETVSFPYCSSCRHYLIDSLISGNCPNCGEESSGGCEGCGMVYPPFEIKNPVCNTCGEIASTQESEIETFNLTQYLPLILKDLKNINLTKRLQTLISTVEKHPSTKVLATLPAQSGIEEIHVWYEMVANYEQFFLSNKTWVHCFGFDNAFYYLLFIPAMMKALYPESKMPTAILTNEFLLLKDKKFSTSRRHAIWADEFKGDIDHLRLYLALERPSTRCSNFTMMDFERFSRKLQEKLDLLQSKRTLHPERPEKCAVIRLERFRYEMERSLSLKACNFREAARILLNFLDSICEEQNEFNAAHMVNEWSKWASIFMPSHQGSES